MLRNFYKQLFFILSGIIVIPMNTIAQPYQPMHKRLEFEWQLGWSNKKNTRIEKWIPAKVPGAVQLDVATAEHYGEYYYDQNWKDYLWMEDSFWVYRTRFQCPDLSENQRLFFFSHGIDYQFIITCNNQKVLEQEGMFTPVDVDITEYLQADNELQVIVFPAPKTVNKPRHRMQASQSVKPPVSYGWDWHPRLIPLGIWDDTYFEIRNISHIITADLQYNLSNTLDSADILLCVNCKHANNLFCRWTLRSPDNRLLFIRDDTIKQNEIRLNETIGDIQLWWSHDYGEQPLYLSEFELLNKDNQIIDKKMHKIGFRQVRLIMNDGAWSQPDEFPKTRSVPPITLELNGKNIFCKGTNWVQPEIFIGTITKSRYKELIDLAISANFNMLRVWGGGVVNKQSFYDLCDEKGILVWQEFPLACNNYEGTPHYLKILAQESESIIKKLRWHPCLAIWCGGNELYNSWSGMTGQSLALRLLNSQCYIYDRFTPFIPTSPLMGMAHGHYVFRDNETGEEVFQWMPRSRNTAYTEFGMPAPSSVDVLKTIIPENELWPPKTGTAWEAHHAFNAWVGDTWLMQKLITHYFGEAKNLEQLVENGQLLQSVGYRCIYEESRRQKPYCSMALNWCYNEPWPTAANNSLINYPAKPKPAYYAVQQACRPVLASARIPKFKWKENDLFSCEIWLLNDSYEKADAGKITVFLKWNNQEKELLQWNFDASPENTNIAGPTAKYKLPNLNTKTFKLILKVDEHPEYNSEYTLLFEKTTSKTKNAELPRLNR